MPYRLADHVRACRIDAQVILLDLQRDKYLGIGGAQLAALSRLILDWPADGAAGVPVGPDPVPDAWLGKLLALRMLADAGTRRAPVQAIEPAHDTLLAHLDPHPTSIRWADLPNLAWSASVATFWMKRRCLADIEKGVRRLRVRPAVQLPADAERLGAAVAAYMRLRPFVFTAQDQCLHDSLTLVRFLAGKGLFASWVVGVRTRPFAAHSWVQSGHLVLNDVHEHVRTYTPLLIV